MNYKKRTKGYLPLREQLKRDISATLYGGSEFKEFGAPADEMDRYAEYIVVRADVEMAKSETDIVAMLKVVGIEYGSADIWSLISSFREATAKLY